MDENKEVGALGEELAEKYLERRGYKIIARNYRFRRWGEIDLVAIEDETTVFVEVKTRLSSDRADYGEPQEAVGRHKMQTLMRMGYYFKMENPDTPEALRIDVVAITLEEGTRKVQKIKLFKDVRLEDF